MNTATVNGQSAHIDPNLTVPAPDIQQVTFRLIGTSPLICHQWGAKSVKQMLDKQMKRAKQGREAKDPERDYRESLYEHPDGGYGFPAIAFKAAMVRAGTYNEMKMTYLRGCFHIPLKMVKLVGEPHMREDTVRIGNGVADIRYRGEFPEWEVPELPVLFNARALSQEQIANLLVSAGFSVGIGEWRPERDGSYGMWKLA